MPPLILDDVERETSVRKRRKLWRCVILGCAEAAAIHGERRPGSVRRGGEMAFPVPGTLDGLSDEPRSRAPMTTWSV